MTPQEKDQELPDSYHIVINGEPREIFMSFGLLNRLHFLVGNLDNIPYIGMEPQLTDAVMRELMAIRTKGGKVEQYLETGDYDVAIKDVNGVLAWAAEHLTNFTLEAARKASVLHERTARKASTLISSLIGQANSALQKPAAPPSDAPQASSTESTSGDTPSVI